MPAELAEDSIELDIDLLEAGEPTEASYPYPSLKRTTRVEGRTFRAIMLENQHFHTTLVPDLGGRIVSIRHRAADREILLGSNRLATSEGGRRGVECLTGIQILTEFGNRLNSMGPVADQPDLGEEDGGDAAVWLGEVDGKGISLNWRVAVSDADPWMEIEVRAFNRTLQPISYNGGIALGAGDWRRYQDVWVWSGASGSLLVDAGDLTFCEGHALHRFDRLRYLAPRQLDSWSVRLMPLSIGSSLLAASTGAVVGWDDAELVVITLQDGLGKVVVKTEKGSVLEMPLTQPAGSEIRVAMDSFDSPIVELVILDHHRNEVLRAPSEPTTEAHRRVPEHRQAWIGEESSDEELTDARFDLRQRHLAHILAARALLAKGAFTEASREFEQSLLFNAEDHLAWWGKAVAERHGGTGSEDRPELLNAHFLAPMDPVLRAESFLSSPARSKEKAAVLNSLEKTPVAFVDVACALIEAGLMQDAADWLAESLLHVDLPILRYLLAYAYLQNNGMDIEAADLVRLANQDQPLPPYPWRPVELQAIAYLKGIYPDDKGLEATAKVAEMALIPN
jgi:hypothetical protein